MKRQINTKGFTLIETMVAITILVVGVAAPLTLASQSLIAAIYSKDQTTAFYLAQEAVEMVRNKRDGNMLQFLGGGGVTWLNGVPVSTNFHVDVQNDTLTNCGSVQACLATKLLHNGTFYNHQTGDSTRFGRSVLVTQNPNLANEATIAVTVEWQTGSLKPRTFTLRERIYNWVPDQQ